MTKRIALVLLVAAIVALLTLNAVALEKTIVKGVCADEHGQPMVGATVEFSDLDNGSKTILKTDSHGRYYSNTVAVGTYKITLTTADGKVSASLNVTVKAGAENVTDFAAAAEARFDLIESCHRPSRASWKWGGR